MDRLRPIIADHYEIEESTVGVHKYRRQRMLRWCVFIQVQCVRDSHLDISRDGDAIIHKNALAVGISSAQLKTTNRTASIYLQLQPAH